jgi:arylsulfatase A-like enzyme
MTMPKNRLLISGVILSIVIISFLAVCRFVFRPASNSSLIPKPERLTSLNNLSFVLINIDSLRADHLGAYGYSENTTPFLDSLSREGVVFKNAITPAYLTFQTDAAIFSGLYPSQNNVQTWDTPINDKLYLLPKILSLYGYKTAAFVSPSLWEYFGFSKQFDEYTLTPTLKNISETKTKVTDWIQNHQNSNFFLFWHIYDVHLPYIQQTTSYTGPFSRFEVGKWKWEAQTTNAIPQRQGVDLNGEIELNWLPFNKDDVEYLRYTYDEGIKYVDAQLQEFFDQIRQLPNYQNTVFIISSEHGEDLKEHGFIFHRDLYDVNTHVPLIIIAPGLKIKEINEPVSLLDLMPTILELANARIPENIEGQSLTPLIEGSSFGDRPIYTERPPYDEYSVRLGGWKYILRNPDKQKEIGEITKINSSADFFTNILQNDSTFTDELYYLINDSQEQNNLIGKGLAIEKKLEKLALEFKIKMSSARSANQIEKLQLPTFIYP